MIRRTLGQLEKMIKVDRISSPSLEIGIRGVSIDSRKVEKGNLFVPLQGEKADGHQFVQTAIENGAAASFWQKDVPNPPENLPLIFVDDTLAALQELARSYRSELDIKVVGITGSNGKTTTKDMTASLLSLKYKVQKTEGNYNNHIGLPLSILALEEDTDIAVLEMGMSGKGEIDFLTKLARPHIAIITNIGESHLLDLGSREGIAEAKLEIINGLSENGAIIYNGDEPLLRKRLETYEGNGKLLTFGNNSSNTLYPVYYEQQETGSVFKINEYDKPFHLPVLGAHNVLNSLAAMLAARQFAIPYEIMDDGFKKLELTSMRMELVEGIRGVKIINDAYNASPTSMRAAIRLVESMDGFKKKILVLGDMLELGPDEEAFHFAIGKELDPEKISELFTFGPLGKHIARGALEVLPEDRVHSYLDKDELIRQLENYIDKETLLLVKASRGMKLEEVVKNLQRQDS